MCYTYINNNYTKQMKFKLPIKGKGKEIYLEWLKPRNKEIQKLIKEKLNCSVNGNPRYKIGD